MSQKKESPLTNSQYNTLFVAFIFVFSGIYYLAVHVEFFFMESVKTTATIIYINHSRYFGSYVHISYKDLSGKVHHCSFYRILDTDSKIELDIRYLKKIPEIAEEEDLIDNILLIIIYIIVIIIGIKMSNLNLIIRQLMENLKNKTRNLK